MKADGPVEQVEELLAEVCPPTAGERRGRGTAHWGGSGDKPNECQSPGEWRPLLLPTQCGHASLPTSALPHCCPAPLFSEPAAEFWDNLLRDKFSTQQEAAAATLGRGARERGKVRAYKEGVRGERGSRARCVCIEGWRGARAGAGGGASTLRGGGRGAGWVS